MNPQRNDELNIQLKDFTVNELDKMIAELTKAGTIKHITKQPTQILNIDTRFKLLDQTTSAGRFYVKWCQSILDKYSKKLSAEDTQFLKASINRETFNENQQAHLRYLGSLYKRSIPEVSRQVEDATWAYMRGDIGYKKMKERQIQ